MTSVNRTFAPQKREIGTAPSIPLTYLLDLTGEDEQTNFFLQYLQHSDKLLSGSDQPFTPEDVKAVTQMYMLATLPLWFAQFAEGFGGACIFPYIERPGYLVRAMEVKAFDQFNRETGSELYTTLLARQHTMTGDPVPDWLRGYKKSDSCLFGAHLLKQHPSNPVAIVSDPVSAIYGTLYFGLPKSTSDLLWMATGPGGLTYDKCKSLKGRRVTMFPDKDAYQDWTEKIDKWTGKNYFPGTTFTISDLLKKTDGTMADYLRQYDWKEFRPNTPPLEPQATIEPLATNPHHSVREWHSEPLIAPEPALVIPGAWDAEIAELDAYFHANEYGSNIPDLETARANNGNPVFRPYLDRAKELKNRQLVINSNTANG